MEPLMRGTFGSATGIIFLAVKHSTRHGAARKLRLLIPVVGPSFRQARQYTALRSLGNVNSPLLRVSPLYPHHGRGVGMFVLRAVRGVLKLRYLVLGGAVSGGMTLQKTYEEMMESLSGFNWMKEYMPSKEQYNKAHDAFMTAKEKLKLDPEIMQIYESRMTSLKEKFAERWEQAKEAADKAKFESKGIGGLLGDLITEIQPSVKLSAVRANSADDREDRITQLQSELITMQLKHNKENDEKDAIIKELRRQILLRNNTKSTKKIKKSLIDMYSDVLEELNDFDSVTYRAQDYLPRVVVVGDQSSGKTSVLEMLVQARIFPRGAGEMMTRAPVMVTVSEGPYRIANFKDSTREFDLDKESDLKELRKEVEMRMKNSVAGGKTVSDTVISMTVQGPGLQRMVLVDLPGIISTVTLEMQSDTRDMIRYMTQTFMSNPNAIILCIQDGSVDAERSNVTDLVAQMDPTGKRTIFVLTKVDLAEENLADPSRIKKILTGRLFPMKALGYFAVVTGRGRQDDSIKEIKQYEENFFRKSKLLKDGAVSSSQVTTRNLSMAVSECFWKMVRETVEQQADSFKAVRFNLETEWKNNFPRIRELDRDELFEKARGELLDEVVGLSQAQHSHWDNVLPKKLWQDNYNHVFENIYMKAAQMGEAATFKTMVDILLKRWADEQLPLGAWQALKDEFFNYMTDPKTHKHNDPVFEQLKNAVLHEVMDRHKWEDKGSEMLRAIQLNTLEDENIVEKGQWDSAIKFLEKTLKEKIAGTDVVFREMFGPGAMERWMSWKYTSPEQKVRSLVKREIDTILHSDQKHAPTLSADELITIRKNLQRNNVEVDNEYIRSTWGPLHRRHFLNQALLKTYQCRNMFFHYQRGIQTDDDVDCSDVVLFWKVEQVLKVTANALRQQVNREARRIEREVKDVLEDFCQDNEKKKTLLTGRRVTLAEELKKVREIQEKLEEFIQALNKEK